MKILLLALLFSCASSRQTPYKMSDDESPSGLRILEGHHGTYISIFSANSYTDKSTASAYSLFGAIDKCYQDGLLTQVIQKLDKSNTKTFIYSHQYTVTNPFNATFQYRRNFPMTHSQHSRSYPVKVEYPTMATTFKCVSKNFAFPFSFEAEDISRDLVHPYTKDFRGGVYMKKVSNNLSFLKEGDVIISLNNFRIDKGEHLKTKVLSNPDVSKSGIIKTKIIRNNKLTTVTISLKDISEQTKTQQLEFVKNQCLEMKLKVKPEICTKL